MNKILLITIIGVLLVGSITAISLNLSSSDFKDKVLTISSSLFYEKLLGLNKIDSIPKNTELDLSDSGLEITKNKEGVQWVRTK